MDDPIQELYALLSEELLNRLRKPACKECGTHGLTASELTVIRQFLSDHEMNQIRRRPGGPQPLGRTLPFGPEDGEEPVQKTA